MAGDFTSALTECRQRYGCGLSYCFGAALLHLLHPQDWDSGRGFPREGHDYSEEGVWTISLDLCNIYTAGVNRRRDWGQRRTSDTLETV